MERYFLLIIVVTLVGVTIQKKNGREANFRSNLLKETVVIAAITPRECNAGYTDILKRYTKFKTSARVVNKEKIQEATASKNNIRKTTKTWRTQVNSVPGSTDPRTLFAILRSPPMNGTLFHTIGNKHNTN
jgi:hypothetical protein